MKLKHDCSCRAKKLALTLCYAVFGLSGVNDDIIEAPRRVLESAGDFIYITILDTQSPDASQIAVQVRSCPHA